MYIHCAMGFISALSCSGSPGAKIHRLIRFFFSKRHQSTFWKKQSTASCFLVVLSIVSSLGPMMLTRFCFQCRFLVLCMKLNLASSGILCHGKNRPLSTMTAWHYSSYKSSQFRSSLSFVDVASLVQKVYFILCLRRLN